MNLFPTFFLKASTMMSLIFLFATAQSEALINFEKENWKEISLGQVPDNKMEYGEKLKIIVNSSSSPTIFKFEEIEEISAIDFDISVLGEMKKPLTETGFEEDSYFQLGLIAVGDNYLGAMGKLFAPKWVKELFGFAPEGKGLEKVYFYNVASQKSSVNQERQNPKSKYMYEKVIFTKDDTGGKMLSYTLPKKLKTTALWIGAEGDYTSSEFTTTVNSIILK
jgi:hypothetical protein